jgi:hypothetical protein
VVDDGLPMRRIVACELNAIRSEALQEFDVEDVARWARSVDTAVARSKAARAGGGFKFELPESLRGT